MNIRKQPFLRKTFYKSQHDPQREVWRLAVLKRDKWKCLKCGSGIKMNLNTHHIKPFSTHPALRYVVFNGITLCKKCHKQMNGNEEGWEKLCYMLLAKTNMIYKLGKAMHDDKEEEKNDI